METTILKNQQTPEKQDKTQNYNDNNKSTWKNVTLGGVSGILIGAGAIYAANAYGQEPTQETPSDPNNGSLQVAKTNDDMSFGDAFAAARAEVGSGGVFHWHGGIYNTYTVEEWNAMTEAERNEFANSVKPEIPASRISMPDEIHVTVHHEYAQNPNVENHSDNVTETSDANVHQVSHDIEEGFSVGNDVHIVATGETEDGHLVVGYDTVGDGQVDIAIVDVDGSRDLSEPDIIMDREGNMARLGDLANTDAVNAEEQGMQEAQAYNTAYENPDVAPDMPDYMSDGQVDGMIEA